MRHRLKMSPFLVFYICSSFIIGYSLSDSAPQSKNANLFLGKYPIPDETPGPIDIDTSEVKNVYLPPLQIKKGPDGTVKLINDGVAIEEIPNPRTETWLTGGPFYNSKYKYYKIRYYWSGNSSGPSAATVNGNGTPIEATVYYYNAKYGSFKNALYHNDGVAIISARIRVTSNTNKQYASFLKTLQKISIAGSSANIKRNHVFSWLNIYPSQSAYFAFPSSYTDELTGKKYSCSTVCILRPLVVSISKKQFKESFGVLKNSEGKHLTNSVERYPSNGRPIIQSFGFRLIPKD